MGEPTEKSSSQNFTLSVHSSPLFSIFLYSKLDNRVYKNTENAPLSTHFYNDLTGLTAKHRKKKSLNKPVFPTELLIAGGTYEIAPLSHRSGTKTLGVRCLTRKGAPVTLPLYVWHPTPKTGLNS